jgi:hypothetical protein
MLFFVRFHFRSWSFSPGERSPLRFRRSCRQLSIRDATALRKWRFVRKQSAPNRAFSPHICLNFERLIQRHDHIVNSSGSDGATITLIPFAGCSSADTRAIIANIIAISFQFLHFGLNKDRYTVNLKAQRGIRGYGFRMHRRPSSQLCKCTRPDYFKRDAAAVSRRN